MVNEPEGYSDFYAFHWRVLSCGYRVEGGYIYERDVLERVAGTYSQYSVFETEGLFRTLLSTTAVAFANKYGLLGLSRSHEEEPNIEVTDRYLQNQASEELSRWLTEKTILREAVALWDSLRSGDVAKVRQVITWEAPGEIWYLAPSRTTGEYWHDDVQLSKRFVVASRETSPQRFARFKNYDVMAPGWYALQQIVNRNMRNWSVTPRLVFGPGGDDTELKIRVIPNNLIGAIWVQFALAIEQKRNYRQCRQCGEWLEVARGTKEDQKSKFCSNACRFKAYRERQHQAQKMFSEGATVKEISAKLGSDLKTVKGWVRK
ncbi:MAG TPA: hypothetical protein VM120_07200 [Bryobacteraceae bacterium]|nr:hypothetical protein [Bryobacteraceae bacterium]